MSHQVDKAEKEEKEEGETDQELPPWIKSKDEFNELKNCILSVKDSSLKTGTDKYQYYFSYMKELMKNIAKNKVTKNDAINRIKEESTYIDEIKSLRRNKNRTTIINFNRDLMQIFYQDYFDKADGEQPSHTDISSLESEESTKQRNQEGQ